MSTHQTTPFPSQENSSSSDHITLPSRDSPQLVSGNMSHETPFPPLQSALADAMTSSSEKLRLLEEDFETTKALVRAQEAAFEPLYSQVRDINKFLEDKQREKQEVEEVVGQLQEE